MATSSPIEVRTMTSKRVRSESLAVSKLLTRIFLVLLKELINLLADFIVGDLNIVFGRSVIAHKREKAIIGDIELSVLSWV